MRQQQILDIKWVRTFYTDCTVRSQQQGAHACLINNIILYIVTLSLHMRILLRWFWSFHTS